MSILIRMLGKVAFACLLLAGAASATVVSAGQEYCSDVYADLDLPSGSCMAEGYLNEVSYSEGMTPGFGLALYNGNELIESGRFGLPLNLESMSYHGGRNALYSMVMNTFLLTTFEPASQNRRRVQLIYSLDKGAESVLRLLEIRLIPE